MHPHPDQDIHPWLTSAFHGITHHPDQDIHPWLTSAFHGITHHQELCCTSPLGKTCKSLNISIHDREIVYEKLKKLEAEVIAERDERLR
jgi:hypothetical protein